MAKAGLKENHFYQSETLFGLFEFLLYMPGDGGLTIRSSG